MSDFPTAAGHAAGELRRAGWMTDENKETGEAILSAVTAFHGGGWSGGSIGYGVETLRRLCLMEPLGPLTDDPEEWFHHDLDVAGQPDLWQSKRDSSCFSNDGGRTYYDVDETPTSGQERTIHKTAVAAEEATGRVTIDPEEDHTVTFPGVGFTVVHPLLERLRGETDGCDLHEFCEGLTGPPMPPDRYRADRGEDGRWTFTPAMSVTEVDR